MVVPCNNCSDEGIKPYTGIHIENLLTKIGMVTVRLFRGRDLKTNRT